VTKRRIAILGGGMLGVCTALELARRGESVTLVDGAEDLLQGASRWNEGKIHLGYLYAADPSLNTARRLVAGGLAFRGLVERHIAQSLDGFTTDDDVFLVHRDSVVDADSFAAYAHRVAELVRDAASANDAPSYLSHVSASSVQRLAPSELARLTTSEQVVAGFRVNERSISTGPVADLLVSAVRAEPRVEVHTGVWIDGVRRCADSRLEVVSSRPGPSALGAFDVVINALWEGRPAVDASLGIRPPGPWTHRFRAAVFGQAPNSTLESGVLCTGPFGDIKRYADGRVYLSWYRAGLLAEGNDIAPPRALGTLTAARAEAVRDQTLAGLAAYFPGVAQLCAEATLLEVHGGWVYAIGDGSLADPSSTLHQRDKFAITCDRNYISVDTAKYSLAPWLAERVARLVTNE
jgi:glycine/D-amino acid oxidase-like deaminating enzyme